MVMPHVSTTGHPQLTYPTELYPQRPENSNSILTETAAMIVDIQYENGTTVSVDISQKNEHTDVLGHLETTGWFLVKNATSVDSNTSQSHLEGNEVGISNMSQTPF
jgi:hypothetical protein